MTSPEHLPRRSGVAARQVLIPGTRKQAPHPWAEALRLSREGGPKTPEGEVSSGKSSPAVAVEPSTPRPPVSGGAA